MEVTGQDYTRFSFPAIPPSLCAKYGEDVGGLALRPFGLREKDIDIDFQHPHRPILITQLLHCCLERQNPPPPKNENSQSESCPNASQTTQSRAIGGPGGASPGAPRVGAPGGPPEAQPTRLFYGTCLSAIGFLLFLPSPLMTGPCSWT